MLVQKRAVDAVSYDDIDFHTESYFRPEEPPTDTVVSYGE
jgi:hypothetical protein